MLNNNSSDEMNSQNREGDDDEHHDEGNSSIDPLSVANNPLDIANGLEDKTIQPRNVNFPKDKKNGRSFSFLVS